MNEQDKLRIDKWLWFARIFKTRSAAASAVNGGKVHVNQQRVKPAYTVKRGDIVQYRKGFYDFELQVLDIANRRGPAKIAQTLYVETEASIAKRNNMRDANYLTGVTKHNLVLKRPDKKQRREIMRFRGKN